MLRKKKYLFIASFPFNTLCTLLREYKTPVPHLKADKRISSTRKDNYAHISHSNIKKKKNLYTHAISFY